MAILLVFRLPQGDPKLYDAWLKRLDCGGLEFTTDQGVCEKHFSIIEWSSEEGKPHTIPVNVLPYPKVYYIIYLYKVHIMHHQV